jgi:hypothetical protein
VTLRRAPLFAQALLEKLDVRGVPDVRQIASALGVEVEEADAHTFDGALVRFKRSIEGVIAIRKSIREIGRKNFTIAHELGHLLLPGHDESTVCHASDVETWDDSLSKQELEANEFAGELLLPSTLIQKVVSQGRPTFEAIDAIATTYATSLTATAYRFIEETSHASALVWSHAGVARWCKRSEEFDQLIRLGEPLDHRTFASNCFDGNATPTRPERVQAEAWLEGSATSDATVFEETRCMKWYNGALTLLWIAEPFPESQSADEGPEAALDPHDFTLRRTRWPR